MISCDLKKVLTHLLYLPVFGPVSFHHIAIEFTHDGKIEYTKNRKDLAHIISFWVLG